MRRNGYRWLVAGTMLGAAGGYMAQTMLHPATRSQRQLRAKMARMAGRTSREAGELLGDLGESLAGRMR